MISPLLLLLFLLLSTAVTALPSLNDRVAVARTEAYAGCLSTSAQRFINATLVTLSASGESDDELATHVNATVYPQLMSRFMTHVTQAMASGLSFCSAFARASGGLVGEWTRDRIPAPEKAYREHCRNVMRATDEADEYLFEGPAFRNGLYRCLRQAFPISAHL